jgi:hypothetical protein
MRKGKESNNEEKSRREVGRYATPNYRLRADISRVRSINRPFRSIRTLLHPMKGAGRRPHRP